MVNVSLWDGFGVNYYLHVNPLRPSSSRIALPHRWLRFHKTATGRCHRGDAGKAAVSDRRLLVERVG